MEALNRGCATFCEGVAAGAGDEAPTPVDLWCETDAAFTANAGLAKNKRVRAMQLLCDALNLEVAHWHRESEDKLRSLALHAVTECAAASEVARERAVAVLKQSTRDWCAPWSLVGVTKAAQRYDAYQWENLNGLIRGCRDNLLKAGRGHVDLVLATMNAFAEAVQRGLATVYPPNITLQKDVAVEYLFAFIQSPMQRELAKRPGMTYQVMFDDTFDLTKQDLNFFTFMGVDAITLKEMPLAWVFLRYPRGVADEKTRALVWAFNQWMWHGNPEIRVRVWAMCRLACHLHS
ncbi:MAG: hypothetical protein EOO65_05125 [Methanosarcinales archaeon]|nr:MAG: hypothetical protein EOO65_05125 [Methanosarcinales archaeon]